MTKHTNPPGSGGDQESNDYAKKINRAQQNINQRKAGEAWDQDALEGKPEGYTNKGYMAQVAKQGIKSQQDSMRDTADTENAKYQHKIPSYRKGGKVRKTGLAYMHKGEKVIPKHKVAKRKR